MPFQKFLQSVSPSCLNPGLIHPAARPLECVCPWMLPGGGVIVQGKDLCGKAGCIASAFQDQVFSLFFFNPCKKNMKIQKHIKEYRSHCQDQFRLPSKTCLQDVDIFVEGVRCRHMCLNHTVGSQPLQGGTDGELVSEMG